MPMRSTRARPRDVFMLSNAHDNGALIRVTCGGCSPVRHYLPEDLLKLFGDVPVMDLDDRMRCERCHEPARVRSVHLAAVEKNGLVVRRLDEVRMVRKV